MAMCIAVFRYEDKATLLDMLEICRNGYLLGQLRTLHEESRPTDIVELKDTRSRLGCARLQLRCVNFDESLRVEICAEEVSDA